MPVTDLHPKPADLRNEVISGLRASPKTLPCKYFYDTEGSQLFDRICELEEYYPTRTEIGILESRSKDIARAIGEKAVIIELGSGSSIKTHVLLDALINPAAYVPIDISRDHLIDAAARIASRYADLPVWPVCADFNGQLELPEHGLDDHPHLIFFPGSTIGNFDQKGREVLLRKMAKICRGATRTESPGRLLIGIDLIKDRGRLERAYNDSSGVTAEFNLNLLQRINRELDANFNLDHFVHDAQFNVDDSRIEMHIESRTQQLVEIDGEEIQLGAGERICTELSHKFSIEGFAHLAEHSGWTLAESWTDPEDLFAVLLFETL
ncbi:MAG TPA: L-histidine N(alpha)-methyltransferase [Myxococcales bacterium]|nr:L-histidine N(alpha)-methyltransferase [Myxococcales bacterium]HIK83833.1 L-histidine N(alpha)-methyltransferase [Myxococcales bacterium]